MGIVFFKMSEVMKEEKYRMIVVAFHFRFIFSTFCCCKNVFLSEKEKQGCEKCIFKNVRRRKIWKDEVEVMREKEEE